MGTSSQKSNAIRFDEVELDGPPTVEKIEALVGLLRQYRERQHELQETELRIVLPGNVDAINEELEPLHIGSAAPDWDKRVKEAWAEIEGGWASPATLKRLESSLETLLEPLRRDTSALDNLETELRIGEARVETLRLLADTLDELTWAQPVIDKPDSTKVDES
jgi:hypothetical protein